MNPHLFTERLQQQLRETLPGKPAQYLMAPSDRTALDLGIKNVPLKESAVMLIVFFKDNEPHILLAQRANYKGPHGGQISFPGGKFDSQHDQTFEDTAKRETFEEIGLKPNHYEIIGKITPLKIPASKTIAYPFVAFSHQAELAKPDGYELVDLYRIPIKYLLNQQNTKWSVNHRFEYPYYDYQGKKIWGATAMMLSEFLTIIKKANLLETSTSKI